MEIDWIAAWAAAQAGGPLVLGAAQIFFWVTGGVVAILTYKRAKKSLFQPAKTEVFKLQVTKLQSLLDALDWNGKHDAWTRSGLSETFDLNMTQLIDAYAFTHGLRPGAEAVKMRPQPAGMLVRPEIAEGELTLVEPGARRHSAPTTAEPPDWSKYRHWEVQIGPKLHQTFDILNRYQADPVIPTAVSEELAKITGDIQSALIAIGPSMDKAAKELPEHYKTRDDVRSAEWGWISNLHPAEHRYGFYERLVNLRASIRTYLKSDQMFDL